MARSKTAATRCAARLAAVQALYQIELAGGDSGAVVAEFADYRLDESVDFELFQAIVSGVTGRLGDIDALISGALTEGWALGRLEMVLRAILRAAIWELLAGKPTPAPQSLAEVAHSFEAEDTAAFLPEPAPPRVVIAEYVSIAHRFFSGREAAMANGILDHLAKRLQPDAFEQPLPDEARAAGR